MNKTKIIKTAAKVVIPLIIFTAIIIFRFVYMDNEGLSLGRYVIVSTSGLNGRASVEISVDEVGLYNALTEDGQDKSEYTDFVNSITLSADRTTELSNNDTIHITISYDEAIASRLGIEVESDTRNYKISGLDAGTELDAFSELKIITGGISPYIYVTYSNESENEYLSMLEYNISKTDNLAIGDEITITCIYDEKTAASQGYYINQSSMTYTIEEADRYLAEDNISDFDQSIIEELNTTNIGVITDDTNDTTSHMSYKLTADNSYLFRDNNETAEGFSLYQVMLANNASGVEREHENYILLIYHGSIVLPTYSSDNSSEYLDAYFCFMYSDVIISMDGEMTMATNNPEQRYVCSDSYDGVIAEANEAMGAGFNLTEIILDK